MQLEAPKRAFLQVNFKPLVLEIYFASICTGFSIWKKNNTPFFIECGLLGFFTPDYKWTNWITETQGDADLLAVLN